ELRVWREPAILPADETLRRADPQRSVARSQQPRDLIGWEALTCSRRPGHVPETVEAKQAEVGPKPEIAVRRLGDRLDRSLGEAVADPPRCVHVLADVERRIQHERAGASGQQPARQAVAPSAR